MNSVDVELNYTPFMDSWISTYALYKKNHAYPRNLIHRFQRKFKGNLIRAKSCTAEKVCISEESFIREIRPRGVDLLRLF